MPRKSSPTQELAYKFVTEILGEEFDYRLHAKHLKNAKQFVNPGEDAISLPVEDVWGCIQALKQGILDYDGPIASLWVITFGTPPFIQQYYEWKKEPPPFYLTDEIRLWQEITGQSVTTETVIPRFVPTL